MAAHRPNLKAIRKRYGLSQSDVAFLVDGSGKGQVSRHERDGVVPGLQTALALQIIFGVPPQELFPNLCESIEQLVGARLRELISELRQREFPKRYRSVIAKKILWLEQHPILSTQAENAIT